MREKIRRPTESRKPNPGLREALRAMGVIAAVAAHDEASAKSTHADAVSAPAIVSHEQIRPIIPQSAVSKSDRLINEVNPEVSMTEGNAIIWNLYNAQRELSNLFNHARRVAADVPEKAPVERRPTPDTDATSTIGSEPMAELKLEEIKSRLRKIVAEMDSFLLRGDGKSTKTYLGGRKYFPDEHRDILGNHKAEHARAAVKLTHEINTFFSEFKDDYELLLLGAGALLVDPLEASDKNPKGRVRF